MPCSRGGLQISFLATWHFYDVYNEVVEKVKQAKKCICEAMELLEDGNSFEERGSYRGSYRNGGYRENYRDEEYEDERMNMRRRNSRGRYM